MINKLLLPVKQLISSPKKSKPIFCIHGKYAWTGCTSNTTAGGPKGYHQDTCRKRVETVHKNSTVGCERRSFEVVARKWKHLPYFIVRCKANPSHSSLQCSNYASFCHFRVFLGGMFVRECAGVGVHASQASRSTNFSLVCPPGKMKMWKRSVPLTERIFSKLGRINAKERCSMHPELANALLMCWFLTRLNFAYADGRIKKLFFAPFVCAIRKKNEDIRF